MCEVSRYERLLQEWVRIGGNDHTCLSQPVWEYMEPRLTPDMRTLEFGSGLSTWLFSEMVDDHTAVESEMVWASRSRRDNVNTIFCPVRSWRRVPLGEGKFDCVLVDGPRGVANRSFILHFLPKLVHHDTLLVIDDSHVPEGETLALKLSAKLRRELVKVDRAMVTLDNL